MSEKLWAKNTLSESRDTLVKTLIVYHAVWLYTKSYKLEKWRVTRRKLCYLHCNTARVRLRCHIETQFSLSKYSPYYIVNFDKNQECVRNYFCVRSDWEILAVHRYLITWRSRRGFLLRFDLGKVPDGSHGSFMALKP